MKHEVVSNEQEIRDGMRAFHTAQERLAASLSRSSVYSVVQTGWYSTDIDPRRGCFAYVQKQSRLEDVVGDIVEVSYRANRSVFVYVLGAADLPYELHLSRRAFVALNTLGHESLSCTLGVWE